MPGLIDRYTLICPLTLGSGTRLFEGPAPLTEFELTGSVTTTKGVIIALRAPVSRGVPHYLLPVYQPDVGVPDAENRGRIAAGLHGLNEELRESGSWMFTRGLHAPAAPPSC
jgi:hypothetical protein